MNIRFRYLLFFAAFLILLHPLAITLGLYSGKVWIDLFHHFLFVFFLALVWFFLFHEKVHGIDRWIFFFSFFGFIFFFSLFWEFFEFAVWKSLPDFAYSFKFYSSTVDDLLSDLLMDILGSVVVLVWYHITLSKKHAYPCS